MGLWQRLFGMETRVDLRRVSDLHVGELFGLRAGEPSITSDLILSNLAVAARCVALRSEMLASVPLFLFRRQPGGGRDRADDNALYNVLHDLWNPNQTAFEGREMLVRSLDLAGNAYNRIERNARGQVIALWPLLPHDVTVERLVNGRLRYTVRDGDRDHRLLQEEVLHVRGPSRDGLVGESPIALARGALGLALAHHATAESLSRNALRPSGLVSFPGVLSGDQRRDLTDRLKARHAGAGNAGSILLMDAGAKFERLAFSPQDAEFIDSRRMSNEDVARVFGLPPTSVGITDKATYSNVEQEARALVQNAIGPLAARIEAAMQRCLLTDQSRRTLYVEHDLDGLLRGDVAARFESYRVAREIGAFSANDVRRRENEPPIAGGDIHHQPANWVALGTVPTPTEGDEIDIADPG